MIKLRKWFRILHRDLSFFFTGMILVYAISGIVLNHRDIINPDFIIRNKSLIIEGFESYGKGSTEEQLKQIALQFDNNAKILKHYSKNDSIMKLFLTGGATIELNTKNGEAYYESIKKRPFFHELNWLHFNPNKKWTIFSDIFAVSLIIITITGLFMNKGKHGLTGRGGLELIAGILIPLVFIFVMK